MTISAWLDSPSAIEQHLFNGIDPDDLAQPGIRFIVCDHDNQVLLHVHVGDGDGTAEPVDPDDGIGLGPAATIIRFVAHVANAGIEPDRPDGLLIALTRSGRPVLTDSDRACFRVARSACAEHNVRLLGVHVVTPRGLREVLLDDAI